MKPANWTDAFEKVQTPEMVAEHTLRLAYERGLAGTTFATYDDYTTPGYDTAWAAGASERMQRQVIV